MKWCIYSYSLQHHLLIVKDEKQHKCPSVEYWLINASTFIHIIIVHQWKETFVCSPEKEEEKNTCVGLYWHTSFCFALLHFADNCIFYKLKGFWQPFIEQVCRHYFSNSISHFVSMSHFDNSHSISNIFIIIFVMVICDQWSLMLLL